MTKKDRKKNGNKKRGEKLKNQLMAMLLKKSFKYSEEPIFTLVSGRKSHFYVNCKPTTLDPFGMRCVGHLIFDAIWHLSPEGVGGLTFGADPLAMATAYVSGIQGQPIQAFSIRKELKDHGIPNWVEGNLRTGARVVIIDDVATTGGSTIRAIERARECDLEVIAAVVLIDRQEGGLENIKKYVPDARAIITRDELMVARGN